MALPLDPNVPGNLSSPGLGDDEIRALKQFLVDIFGFPVSPTAVSSPIGSTSASGVFTFAQNPAFPISPVKGFGLQIFTLNGTYIKPAGLLFTRIICIGGGGGGAGAASVGGSASAGGGGGSGGYSESWLAAASIGASEPVVIGTGGSGGLASPGSGGPGTITQFGALVSALGGFPGTANLNSIGGPGAGGTPSFGQISIQGQAGSSGFITTAPAPIAMGGNGGHNGPYSTGGVGSATGTASVGTDGTLGGGGAGGASGGLNNAVGGAGGAGLVIVVEFLA